MTKRKFLSTLERRLEILNEEERKDIISEYRDIIDDKIKHGTSEEEAVASFGSMDDLVSSILCAYKINPNYGKDNTSSKKVKDAVTDTDTWIKRVALKMTNVTKEVVADFKENHQEFTMQLIFEMIIKAVILVVVLAIMKIPFLFIEHMGRSILDMAFYPLDEVLMFFWSFLIGVLYFICCILIIVVVFQSYFNKRNSKEEVQKKKTVDKQIKPSSKIKKSSFRTIVSGMIHVFIVVFILLPLWLITICFCLGLGFLIFFLLQGIDVVGVLLLTLSFIIFFMTFATMIYNLCIVHRKVHLSFYFISVCLFALGLFLTIHTFFKFEYVDEVPGKNLSLQEDVITEELNGRELILGDYNKNVEVVIDNTVEVGSVSIMVSYYDDFLQVEPYYDNERDSVYLRISTFRKYNHFVRKEMYEMILSDLRNYTWHDYEQIYEPEVVVHVHERTKDQIKIMK